MTGHSDDILSLEVSADRSLVATGQQGARPCILLWDPTSLMPKQCLRGFHRRAVLLLRFSKDQRLLASIGGDDDHSLAIYAWRDAKIVATAAVCKRKVTPKEDEEHMLTVMHSARFDFVSFRFFSFFLLLLSFFFSLSLPLATNS